MTTTAQTGLSWGYEYMPYVMTGDDGKDTDIPCYRVFPEDHPENYVCETNEHLPDEEQEKYARLISAAPELFEALRYFFNIMHDYESSVRKGYVKLAFGMARAALAKAKEGPV
ncbi:MAG: hypothetical protein QM756_05175 [Polyangiaceae bacterium]